MATDLADEDPYLEPIAGNKEIGALAHLYRAEIYRSTIWRQRLDTTTNWAVLTTGVALSISFASAEASELPIILANLMAVMFLMLEARRYRYFHVWKFRARVLELAFYVPLLRGEGGKIIVDRGSPLSDDYESPKFRISYLRAVGLRIRRTYGYIFTILGLSYIGKEVLHPTDIMLSDTVWREFMERAAVGPLPGWLNLALGAVFHATWIVVAAVTKRTEVKDKSVVKDVLE